MDYRTQKPPNIRSVWHYINRQDRCPFELLAIGQKSSDFVLSARYFEARLATCTGTWYTPTLELLSYRLISICVVKSISTFILDLSDRLHKTKVYHYYQMQETFEQTSAIQDRCVQRSGVIQLILNQSLNRRGHQQAPNTGQLTRPSPRRPTTR